jgi:hypothetical protein
MGSREDNGVATLGGPVEDVGGKLQLRMPLAAGGEHFIECTRKIARVDGPDLVVTLPEWLATKLGITAGMEVVVDNRDGKFNIYPQYGKTH